jgi:hypothetical protein
MGYGLWVTGFSMRRERKPDNNRASVAANPTGFGLSFFGGSWYLTALPPLAL